MKFHWFNLMPWPYLPDDFAEKHRSVWVDVDSRLFDPVKANRVYNDYLDLLEYAGDLGFDGLGINEHHQNAYGLMPSPQLMASTLARRTRDASIMLLGQSIALYDPPTRVAEEMAMIDCISGGRLIAGFPVGTSMDDNYACGANPALLREKYYEAHDLIRRAWSDPDVFTWSGQHYQLRYVNLWPRPIQNPPPIWIPGGGSLETWDFCAKHDYNYSYLSFTGYIRGAQLMEGFWKRMEQLGREFNPYQAAFAQQIVVAETDAEAQRLYEKHVRYFFSRCLHVYPGYADAPGYRTEATLRAGLGTQVAGQGSALNAAAQLSWQEMIDQGFIVAGSPDSVAEQMEKVARTLRLGHIVCLLHIGDMPNELCKASTDLFASKVIPQLRSVWGEYEDRWSPKPMPREDRAIPRDVSFSATDAAAPRQEVA
ncbi:MAG: LLM class flavin-dependent oxidoreductase [Gammaproteobacteria bacterium]|nr:LLM class flavin-dependent oxidoreductase [Gammaproteobacteria bacterium]MCP5199703.1 LLM class flavin-dependent oxidoreductase [Gammaproteobacteria bacterium]